MYKIQKSIFDGKLKEWKKSDNLFQAIEEDLKVMFGLDEIVIIVPCYLIEDEVLQLFGFTQKGLKGMYSF